MRIRPGSWARTCLCGLALLLCQQALADIAGIGTIKTITGEVQVQRGAATLTPVPGFELQEQDVVRTGAASTVGIVMRDKTILSAGASSELRLDKFNFDNKTQTGAMQTTLRKGRLSAISGAIVKHSPEAVQFKTSTMTLGVRGTEFIIETEGGGS
ncbi:FecR family protein [Vogesella oryzae]|uniref:FecR family protein n=1 Tax=Vogesella oryzae TaxID=1735285 RepID=UPI001C2DFEA2|nr:FecR domain-containing protein [Vogesella oryzae]